MFKYIRSQIYSHVCITPRFPALIFICKRFLSARILSFTTMNGALNRRHIGFSNWKRLAQRFQVYVCAEEMRRR